MCSSSCKSASRAAHRSVQFSSNPTHLTLWHQKNVDFVEVHGVEFGPTRLGSQVHLPTDFEVVDRQKDPLGKQIGVVDVTRGVPPNQEVPTISYLTVYC